MDSKDLLELARGARDDRPQARAQALACKIARGHKAKASESEQVKRQKLELTAQIKVSNLSNAVTCDDIMRQHGEAPGPEAAGQGRWRMWNARTSLKVAFRSVDIPATTIGKTMDPPRSKGHITEVQNAVSCLCTQKAKDDLSNVVCPPAGQQHECFITDSGIDTTEFRCCTLDGPAMKLHVLAQHGRCLWRDHVGQVFQRPLAFAPRGLRANTASCHWAALHDKVVPVQPIAGSAAKHSGTIVSHDQHVVNYALIHKLVDEAPETHLVGSDPCLQHRTGNCLEPLTRHLGIASPIFCLANVERQGTTYKDILDYIAERLSNPNLVSTVDDSYVSLPQDKEYAEALLEATHYRHEAMQPADLEMSEAELALLRQKRRDEGAALIHMLPGNWRQGMPEKV